MKGTIAWSKSGTHSEGVKGAVPQDPRDTVKAGLLEAQFQKVFLARPTGKTPETGTSSISDLKHITDNICNELECCSLQPPELKAMDNESIKGTNGPPTSR